MIGYVDAPAAWTHTQGMARAAGVDLPDAVIEGWLTRDELATLVGRCERCGAVEACTGWLTRCGKAARLPGFCRNRDDIEALA